jgi:hypothetical protein
VTVIDGVQLDPVPGTTGRVGTSSNLYRYTIYVETGLQVQRKRFGRAVDDILGDPRGWIRGNKVSFQRVNVGAGTTIILARGESVDALCYPLQTEGEVSCCVGGKVVINLERWRKGVPHWTGKIHTYRQMLVNHEIGHRIGKSHDYCAGPGKLAPCMMQQTYGLQSCIENSWPLDYEL